MSTTNEKAKATKERRQQQRLAEYAQRVVGNWEAKEDARTRRQRIKRAESQLLKMGWSEESTQIWLDDLFGRSGAEWGELDWDDR